MSAETSIVRIDRPFTGGQRDDPKDSRQATDIIDGLYPQGVLVERGGWTDYGVTSGQITHHPLVCFEEIVTGSGETTPDIYGAYATGAFLLTSASRNGEIDLNAVVPSSNGGIHFMRGLFQGEVLMLPQDGETPIMCNVGQLTAGEGVLGGNLTGVSVSLSDSLAGRGVSSASDQFSPDDVGRYIYIDGLHGTRRIVTYLSGGKVMVDVAWDAETSGDSGKVAPIGRLGLHTEVTRVGRVLRVGAGTGITGAGTRWNTVGVAQNGTPQQTAAAVGFPAGTDVIAPIGVDYGQPLRISSVVSDTSISLMTSAAEFDGAAYVDYVVGRPLVGKVACVHEGRLYTAGVKWAPRRLQVSPPLWDGRTSKNGEFSYEVEIGRAMIVASIEVGGRDIGGEITGLLSLPSGNLAILCDDSAWILWGQYPSASVRKIKDVGNLNGLSCLSVDDGAWYAGREGVFEFVGNEPRSITDGHIDSSWRRLMREGEGAGDIQIQLGMIHDHLLVTVHTPSSDVTYVWHRRSRTWCGTWTLPGSVSGYYSSRQPGAPDRLLVAYDDPILGDLSTTIVDELTAVTVDDHRGNLLARTPFDVAGPLSREREVKYAKVEYQAVGSGATLELSTGPDAMGEEKVLPATTGEEIGSVTAYPRTTVGDTTPSNLGKRTRRFDVTLERAGGNPDVVAVHEIELLVKEYRHRDG